RVTSIAMLQTLSHFFAAKCPEGWRGVEVCYRAQRRGFSAPWGCSDENHRHKIYSVEERTNGQKKKARRGVEKETEKANGRGKPLIILRNLDQLVKTRYTFSETVLGSITDEGSFRAYVRGIAGYTFDVKPAWK
ncbi:hypothetical protein ALC62_02080, partial [Cyphomyrmex costatus]